MSGNRFAVGNCCGCGDTPSPCSEIRSAILTAIANGYSFALDLGSDTITTENEPEGCLICEELRDVVGVKLLSTSNISTSLPFSGTINSIEYDSILLCQYKFGFYCSTWCDCPGECSGSAEDFLYVELTLVFQIHYDEGSIVYIHNYATASVGAMQYSDPGSGGLACVDNYILRGYSGNIPVSGTGYPGGLAGLLSDIESGAYTLELQGFDPFNEICSRDLPETITLFQSNSPDKGPDLCEGVTDSGCEEVPQDPDFECYLVQRCDCDTEPPFMVHIGIIGRNGVDPLLEPGDVVKFGNVPGCYEILQARDPCQYTQDEMFALNELGRGVDIPLWTLREVYEDCESCLPEACECCASGGAATYLESASFSIGTATSTPSDVADEWNKYVAGNWTISAADSSIGCAESIDRLIPITEYPGEFFRLSWNVIGPFSDGLGGEVCFWRCQVEREHGTLVPGGYVVAWLTEIPPCSTDGTPTTEPCNGDPFTLCFSAGNSSNTGVFDTFPDSVTFVPNAYCPPEET